VALEVQNAIDDGELPTGTTLRGYGDLMRREGNMEEKYNASVRWSNGDWGAYVSMLKLGSFYDADRFLTEGGKTTNWTMPTMTTYNASFDYDFDAFGAENRVRFGVNNLTDERAPICDCRFGYWSDAHRDTGRYWYLELRMRID
jgi:outer membrane receptor protein involved in Fe transport